MGRAPAVPRVAGAAASNGNQRRPRAVGRRRRSSRMCSSGRRTRGRRTSPRYLNTYLGHSPTVWWPNILFSRQGWRRTREAQKRTRAKMRDATAVRSWCNIVIVGCLLVPRNCAFARNDAAGAGQPVRGRDRRAWRQRARPDVADATGLGLHAGQRGSLLPAWQAGPSAGEGRAGGDRLWLGLG